MIDPEHVYAPSAGMLAAEQLRQELAEARRELTETRAALKRSQERYQWLMALSKRVAFAAVELQDINDGLTAENIRLVKLVKLHMAADLARADLDRD